MRSLTTAARQLLPGLIELRIYAFKPEHYPEYLKLTGSDAFKPRLEASKLNAFFNVELGATLNSAVHLWEYDSLDHRSDVRAQLAGHQDFNSYFDKIRPWLLSQQSFVTKPSEWSEPDSSPGVFALVSGGKVFRKAHLPTEFSTFVTGDEQTASNPMDSGLHRVALLTELVGEQGRTHALYKAASQQALLEGLAWSNIRHGSQVQILSPTAFSPMK